MIVIYFFNDVVGAILKEESKQNNKEDTLKGSKQIKTPMMTKCKSMKHDSKSDNDDLRRHLKKIYNKKNEWKNSKASISQSWIASVSYMDKSCIAND